MRKPVGELEAAAGTGTLDTWPQGRAVMATVSSRPVAAGSSVARSLTDLLVNVPEHEVRGDTGISVGDVVYRSTGVRPGSLFFCVPGARVDGHDFAEEAVRAGAAVLVVERWLPARSPQVLVPSVRTAMGPISAAFFGRPGDRLTMVGVTGTNGKTTTTHLLEHVFHAAGLVPGLIGTTGARIAGEPVPFSRTTPEAPDLQRLLSQMLSNEVRAVAMEVSSHGLHQHRVDGVRYACAVFTNLSQDHLDYHGSMETYFEAKARLFTPQMAESVVVNHDSGEGHRLLRVDIPSITYGLGEDADVRATDVETSRDGVTFRLGDLLVRSRLRGMFNVFNCLAALATARVLGIPDEVAAQGIGELKTVPGRVEPIEAGQDFLVMVDYAHTPDSMENLLLASRPLAHGRLIVVFGCGGDRDRQKRPIMGRAATTLADLTIVTSDNPRSEDPLAIISEIEVGAKRGGGVYLLEADRREAIRRALAEARAGDMVVIAGKGHETEQEFADRTIPFDDRQVAAQELRRLEGES